MLLFTPTRLTCIARLCTILGLLMLPLAHAQAPRDRAVEVTASAQTSPPKITLQWSSTPFPISQQRIYRRPNTQANWSLIASPLTTATSFVDTSVSLGERYEYWIYRTFPDLPSTASGYISTGIRAPFQADRGRLILLVEASMASPLATELSRWEKDLMGDGWTVIRQNVSRTATPPTIKSIIQTLYSQDPSSTKALILFGNIPVPYSGDFAADGHLEHYGAWPADVYYADIDGTWTDTTINDEGGLYVNWNTPGDGKFDQSQIPSDVELQTGRIDLSNLPAFSLSETELLRQYLNRNHSYRFRQGNFANVPRRALIDDHFGFFAGESFATDAWRSFTPICGAGNVTEADWFETLATESHLWAYGCGGGSSDAASGVGSTADFASTDSRAVFSLLFGSWFGDWNQEDNFLRAPLAGRPGSLGLASYYASRPRSLFHPMALGETIGYCTKLSQNNLFSPLNGYDSSNTERFVLSALQGDPTLRLFPVIPPTNLTATPTSNKVTLSWTASTDTSIEGYIISRADSTSGPYTQLRGAYIPGTSYIDYSANPGTSYSYMIRAVKLETSPSGTFLNPSQGSFTTNITTAPSTTAEINVSSLGKPISAGDTLPIHPNGTDFGTAVFAQSGISRTFTISNPGTSNLQVSIPQISGTHAANFWITTPPVSSLTPGASTQFEVFFVPSALGIRSATITIAANDSDESNFQFAIQGTCVAAPAVISPHPLSISRSINPGTTANSLLTISNLSTSPLTHKLTNSLSKYSFKASNTPGGPTYQWREISNTGTLLSWQDTDEGLSTPIPIGFSFPFYGNTFSSLRVCTNGFITFTGKVSYGANSILPNISASENTIAVYWSDIFWNSSYTIPGKIFHKNQNSEFIIQFEALPIYGNTDTRVTCQIILKPSGEILLQYKALTQSGNNYTIGIQNGTRDEALLISYNSPYAQPGLAVRINPPSPISWLTPSVLSGTLAPNTIQSIPITINSANLALGDYFAEISITSDDALVPTEIIPVHLKVGNTPIQDWRQSNFQTTNATGNAADHANPDGDGSINLLEYAFVSDPRSPQSTSTPSAEIHPNGYLQTEFKRHTARTDLRYIVQVATDLQGPWTDIAASDHGAPTRSVTSYSVFESGLGPLKTVTVQDESPTSSSPRRFIRLAIIRD